MEVHIAIVGPTYPGKSSIVRRLEKEKFGDNFSTPTVGANVHKMQLKISGQKYKIQIVDCQGVSDNCRLKDIPFWRKCNAFIVVMDLTNIDSFVKAKQCFEELKNECNPESQLMAVIGNKVDLKEARKIDQQESSEYWLQNSVHYVEGSAKTGRNIKNIFEMLAKAVIVDLQMKRLNEIKEKKTQLQKVPEKKSKKSGGCGC